MTLASDLFHVKMCIMNTMRKLHITSVGGFSTDCCMVTGRYSDGRYSDK